MGDVQYNLLTLSIIELYEMPVDSNSSLQFIDNILQSSFVRLVEQVSATLRGEKSKRINMKKVEEERSVDFFFCCLSDTGNQGGEGKPL